MWMNLIADVAKLGLFVALGYWLLMAYVRHRQPQRTAALARRRLASLALLTLAVSAVKVLEDVLAKESGPVDEAVLWFIRAHVGAALGPLFEAISVSGSARVLLPLAVLASVLLCWAGRWFEAALLAGSLLAANLLVYALKAGVGRARPDLWQTDWYWGSSFPSGHTLSVAAFATAAALCVGRLWPRASTPSMILAVLWTTAVALSRLVLGVHWPTDVLAAICLGASLPLWASLVIDLRSQRGCASTQTVAASVTTFEAPHRSPAERSRHGLEQVPPPKDST